MNRHLTGRHRKLKTATDTTPAASPRRIGAHHFERHLLSSEDGTWAWFMLEPQRWAYRSGEDRAKILADQTARWAGLVDHRIHLRVTNRQLPHKVWAETLDRNSPDRLDDVAGGESFGDYLRDAQLNIAMSNLGDPATFLGVRLTTTPLTTVQLRQVLDRSDRTLTRDLDNMRVTLRRVTETVAGQGFGGKPLTPRAMAWLLHVSVALGVGYPHEALAQGRAGWGPDEMDTFTSPVTIDAPPYASSVRVRALRNGRETDHWLSVLSAARMPERHTEDGTLDPWLSFAQTFPFPVEFSMIADVVSGEGMVKAARFYRRRATSIAEHHDDHDEEPPGDVLEGIADAKRIEKEVSSGTREEGVRIMGALRAAVWGPDEEACRSAVNDFITEYARHQRIEWDQTYGQQALVAEFIPGNTHRRVAGYRRTMPATYLATAMPNRYCGLGDNVGPYIGSIAGGRGAYMLDPTWGPRHDQSGVAAFVADPGGGKSSLAGHIVESAARRGHRTTVVDPSGALARLAALPHLAPYARVIDLSGAEPGTLRPYAMVPEPRLHDFQGNEAKWRLAVREAATERIDLAVDTFGLLLPPTTAQHQPGVLNAVQKAVTSVGGHFATNPWEVVATLNSGDANAKEAADLLTQAAQMKGGALIFPENRDRHGYADSDAGSDKILTVVTMSGLTPPPAGTPRHDWRRSELMAVPLMHLTARWASRTMYADEKPKVIVVDEGGIIAAAGSSFGAFLLRASRDSRKHNTFLAVLMQNPTDKDAVSGEFTNLLGMAAVGRIRSARSATAALELLGVPAGVGYEQVLGNLMPGEFIIRDWLGRVARVNVHLRPVLAEALNTTPPQFDDEMVDVFAEMGQA